MTEQFTFASDPAHGWLLVTDNQLKKTGLCPEDFSSFSFEHKWDDVQVYALEEDCDAALFLKALEKQDIDHTIREQIHSDGDSFVRSWPSITRRFETA